MFAFFFSSPSSSSSIFIIFTCTLLLCFFFITHITLLLLRLFFIQNTKTYSFFLYTKYINCPFCRHPQRFLHDPNIVHCVPIVILSLFPSDITLTRDSALHSAYIDVGFGISSSRSTLLLLSWIWCKIRFGEVIRQKARKTNGWTGDLPLPPPPLHVTCLT